MVDPCQTLAGELRRELFAKKGQNTVMVRVSNAINWTDQSDDYRNSRGNIGEEVESELGRIFTPRSRIVSSRSTGEQRYSRWQIGEPR